MKSIDIRRFHWSHGFNGFHVWHSCRGIHPYPKISMGSMGMHGYPWVPKISMDPLRESMESSKFNTTHKAQIEKIGSNAKKNVKKIRETQQNPDICAMLVFAHPLTPYFGFINSIRPASDQKIIKNDTWKRAWDKKLPQNARNTPNMRSQNSPKTGEKTWLWAPRCPFGCSRDFPGRPQGAKMEAPSWGTRLPK